MKLRDMTELAVRNLREAILRNSLTTLGVAVGVASLVAMLSLGVGLQQLATSRLSKSGLFDSIFVTAKTNLRGARRRPPPHSGGSSQSASTGRNGARRICQTSRGDRSLSADSFFHRSPLRWKALRHYGRGLARILEGQRLL